MSFFVCLHCGHEFSWEELKRTYDRGTGHYDDECPSCGSEDIEEAESCVECGAVKSKDSLINGICAGCIKEAAEDMRLAYQYGADRTSVIELNGVLAMAFTRVQIEAILENWLMTNGDFGKECFQFATDDEGDFAEWLKEEKK